MGQDRRANTCAEKRGPIKITSRLPRRYVLGVWSVTIVGFLLLWFAIPLFDLECESPCDEPAYVALGFLELGIVVLVVARTCLDGGNSTSQVVRR
jgi:hypothetical protein